MVYLRLSKRLVVGELEQMCDHVSKLYILIK